MRKGRFLLWGFKPPEELVRSALGSLERDVLEIVWRNRGITVRGVHEQLGADIAYTTVMTTLDRLYRKRLLDRTKSGRAFVYAARATRQELEDSVASDVVNGLMASQWSAPLPFLSNLVDTVGERDHALLDELERLVRTKRRQLKDRSES